MSKRPDVLSVDQIRARTLVVKKAVGFTPDEEKELRHLVHKLARELHHLSREINALNLKYARLELQVQQVVPNFAALQAQLQSRMGQVTTIVTPSGPVTGTVTLVGTDVVELSEPDGSIVLVPFTSIVAIE